MLNPGAHPAPGYAALADLLITFEGDWDAYCAAPAAPPWTDGPPADPLLPSGVRRSRRALPARGPHRGAARRRGALRRTRPRPQPLVGAATRPSEGTMNRHDGRRRDGCSACSPSPCAGGARPRCSAPLAGPVARAPGAGSRGPGTAWQWQLDGRVDAGVDVPVYDIDGFENDAATVARLHRDGRKVICYVNAGAWESFRPDHGDFPASVLGRANGWEGERWLDIRRLDILRPLMAKRMDICRERGFDAVEPDLLDAYLNDTGFPLTAAHQLAYNRMIARLAHERGLSVGLKNDLPQVPQLVRDFDFAVNEECAQYDDAPS